jgi:hypothetical protein
VVSLQTIQETLADHGRMLTDHGRVLTRLDPGEDPG